MDQLAKSKMKEFNAKSIFLFFLIAFGWTWFWWFPILYLFTRYGSQLFFGLQQPPLIYVSTPWLIIPPFIASILNGGLSEEFGWRGYALPHFQTKWSASTSALILGFIEGCWHIPLIFMPGDVRFGMPIWVLVLPYLAVGIFRAWVYNNTGESVLAAVLFHAAGNVTGEVIPFNVPSIYFFYIIEFVVALAIILLYGPKTLIRDKVATDTIIRQ